MLFRPLPKLWLRSLSDRVGDEAEFLSQKHGTWQHPNSLKIVSVNCSFARA
jgi:hypothetical protein